MIDSSFRRGAAHGAQWLRQVARDMVEEGATPQMISDRLGDLSEVLQDWRQGNIGEMPPGNPWEWPAVELDAFIGRRRDEW